MEDTKSFLKCTCQEDGELQPEDLQDVLWHKEDCPIHGFQNIEDNIVGE